MEKGLNNRLDTEISMSKTLSTILIVESLFISLLVLMISIPISERVLFEVDLSDQQNVRVNVIETQNIPIIVYLFGEPLETDGLDRLNSTYNLSINIIEGNVTRMHLGFYDYSYQKILILANYKPIRNDKVGVINVSVPTYDYEGAVEIGK